VDPDDNVDDEPPPASRLRPIHDGLARRFDTARSVRYGGFSAVYDMTPDGHPIIGRAESVEGLWHNCGWSGNGFANAPAAGRHVAAMILGQRCELDLTMFSWPRPDGVTRMVY
jgi:glycine/D-amino acid oxidase-like deaminating enzyme